jgi:ADP-ribosylglycohydrolase
MPFHWEYSQSTIASKVGAGHPEFFSPPMDLWYKGKTGMSTPYGQQALAYLAVGANSSAGAFDPRAVEAAYWALYNPAVCPGNGGGWYLDESTREFISNVQAGRHYPNSGGNDNQADAAAHMVAVVALLAGNTSLLLDTLEPVIRVTQDTQDAAAFGSAAARLLEKALTLNVTAAQAVALTAADLQDPARAHPYPQDAALAAALLGAAAAAASGEGSASFILKTGQSCDYPFTLPNVAFLMCAVGDDVTSGFIAGARQNILAGGDSGSRGVFRGAIQGARLGSKDLLPSDWAAKTDELAQVRPLAAALVARRAAAPSPLST